MLMEALFDPTKNIRKSYSNSLHQQREQWIRIV